MRVIWGITRLSNPVGFLGVMVKSMYCIAFAQIVLTDNAFYRSKLYAMRVGRINNVSPGGSGLPGPDRIRGD